LHDSSRIQADGRKVGLFLGLRPRLMML
jgi:hypothetical protein